MKTAGVSWYLSWLAGASLVTLTLYGLDKWRARRHEQRVPETVLHAVLAAWLLLR